LGGILRSESNGTIVNQSEKNTVKKEAGEMNVDSPTGQILIVEPNASGHHFYYVRLLVERALQKSRNCSVVLLTTEESKGSRQFQIHLSDFPELRTVSLEPKDFSLSNLSGNQVVRESTQVTFPDSDKVLVQLAIGRWKVPAPTTFLVMRPDGEPRTIKGLGRVIGLAKLILITLCNLRAKIKVFGLKSPIAVRKTPIPWISDPITLNDTETKVEEFKRDFARLPPLFWIGVFGYVNPRKNLDLVISAISDRQDFGLLIAGTLNPEVQRSLSVHLEDLADRGRLIVIPGPLDDASLDSAIASVDIVVAAHSNDGPSGIVAKAAALGKPLAMAGAKSLRTDAKHLGLQARWTKLDSHLIYESLELLSKSGPFEPIAVASQMDFVRKLLP